MTDKYILVHLLTRSESILNVDPEKILSELHVLRGGVADTSTVIYLERLHLLAQAGEFLQLLLPPDVVLELGWFPKGCVISGELCAAGADKAVLSLAVEHHMPVLSEDRRLLMAGRRLGVKHYNTLMILLALLIQEKLCLEEYRRAHSSLREIARYNSAVWQVGEKVFSLYVR